MNLNPVSINFIPQLFFFKFADDTSILFESQFTALGNAKRFASNMASTGL